MPSKMMRLILSIVTGNLAMDKRESINHIHRVINEIHSLLKTIKRLKSARTPSKAKKNAVFSLVH